jgi:hypothetical protein
MTFVQFFASDAAFASFVLIAVLAAFAITVRYKNIYELTTFQVADNQIDRSDFLFDFFVHRHFFQYRIEFFQFKPLGCVLFVLGSDIPAGPCFAAVFVFGAFHDHLDPAAFFCHDKNFLSLDFDPLGPQPLYSSIQAILVDGAQTFRRHLQGDPLVFFGKKKALGMQIGQKSPLGFYIGV